ncbi:MAG: phosphatidate cytidylyltransferase [Deltaproteobacteria bacterium]|nr:MAG: phosphatidate cytidylyltransferase [Deltaproteobacteria bacterium]
MSGSMSNLASRVLVAVVAVPILLAAMYQQRPEWTWVLVFAASLVAMYEFFAMALDDRTDRAASLAIGAAAAAALYWVPAERGAPLLAMAATVVGPGIYYLFRFGDQATVARRLAFSVTGIAYGGLLTTFIALLKRDAAAAYAGATSGHFILLILAVPWISDTSAYFAGRALGRHKLYPAVSPGKTVEGGIGGLAGACAAAAVVKAAALGNLLSWIDVAVLGLAGGALCQIGDLIESLLKRSLGVKDSGTIFAGHGGALDRIDAVIVFAPFVYLYLRLAA